MDKPCIDRAGIVLQHNGSRVDMTIIPGASHMLLAQATVEAEAMCRLGAPLVVRLYQLRFPLPEPPDDEGHRYPLVAELAHDACPTGWECLFLSQAPGRIVRTADGWEGRAVIRATDYGTPLQLTAPVGKEPPVPETRPESHGKHPDCTVNPCNTVWIQQATIEGLSSQLQDLVQECYALRALWGAAASALGYNMDRLHKPRGEDERALLARIQHMDYGHFWSGKTQGWLTDLFPWLHDNMEDALHDKQE